MNTWQGATSGMDPGQSAPAQEVPGEVAPGPVATPTATAPPCPIPPDMARLFRRTLAQGRMHPLMPLLMQYRRSRGEAPMP